MPLYFLNDHGDTIFNASDQKVYSKVGTNNLNLPNESWGVGDVGGITGFTYNTADAQGTTIYTAAQMAVAENLYFENFGPLNPGWYDVWLSAPVDGVLRYCERAGYGGSIRVNGIQSSISYAGGGNNDIRQAAAQVRNVAAGDHVEVYPNSSSARIAFGIIPFVYPPV